MLSSHCPKQLSDDCLELVADINAHIVHDNFELDGQTPKPWSLESPLTSPPWPDSDGFNG
jgi:hypothetical protein